MATTCFCCVHRHILLLNECMIVYDLKCTCGCQFEGWFENRSQFEQQNRENHIACPQCGSDDIDKILSPVAVRRTSADCFTPNQLVNSPEQAGETFANLLREVQEYVEENFEDVGHNLAKESLKIHYGVSKARNICGVATDEEEKMLKDEGVELLKIPMVKKSSDPEVN